MYIIWRECCNGPYALPPLYLISIPRGIGKKRKTLARINILSLVQTCLLLGPSLALPREQSNILKYAHYYGLSTSISSRSRALDGTPLPRRQLVLLAKRAVMCALTTDSFHVWDSCLSLYSWQGKYTVTLIPGDGQFHSSSCFPAQHIRSTFSRHRAWN